VAVQAVTKAVAVVTKAVAAVVVAVVSAVKAAMAMADSRAEEAMVAMRALPGSRLIQNRRPCQIRRLPRYQTMPSQGSERRA